MTKLDWNAIGQRFYETGVDRGVLYVGSAAGVAWPGLTSVTESPSGGTPRPYYLDGVKYLNLASAEEFEATVNALYSPPEFGPCDGTVSIQNGLFVTQQVRQSFGFAYRSRLGNDTEGSDFAYKIHLVYNALAKPASISRSSIGDSVDPVEFSWGITTLPPSITGYKRTAHLIIDSQITPDDILSDVEDILYGTPSANPRLPLPDELIELFSG